MDLLCVPLKFGRRHWLAARRESLPVPGGIQRHGIDVAVWVNGVAEETNYFAVRQQDVHRLGKVMAELETAERFGVKFSSRRTEELFAAQKTAESLDETSKPAP